MTLNKYITLYETKTGESYELPVGFRLFYLPNRGFCQYAKSEIDKAIIVYHCCGDGEFWRDYGALMAKDHGYDKLVTLLCRPVKPYIRAMKWTITRSGVHADGREWYVLHDTTDNLVIIRESHTNPNTGNKIYHVTKGV